MTYDPTWTDASRLAPAVHRVRRPHLAELTVAINRRFGLTYQPQRNYAAALDDPYVGAAVLSYTAPPPYENLRRALTLEILSAPNGGLGGVPPSPTEMTWLWPVAGADLGKPISTASPPPEGHVSLFDKLNGTAGWTDPQLCSQNRSVRAVHFNELRQVCEWLIRGRWELPIYFVTGMHSQFPDTPWWGDIVANNGTDEVRVLGSTDLRTEHSPPRGLVNVTVLPSSYIEIQADWPSTIEVRSGLRPIDFIVDQPTWNQYSPAQSLSWAQPGGWGGADSRPIGSLACPQGQWVRLDGQAVASALQGIVDGDPRVILARRSDTGTEAVWIQGRLGVEFILNSPGN